MPNGLRPENPELSILRIQRVIEANKMKAATKRNGPGRISAYLAGLFLVVGYVIAFRDVLSAIDFSWREGPVMDHGYLVLLISAWLLYNNQKENPLASKGPSLLFLIPIGLLSLLHVAGISNLQQVTLPLILILSLGAIFGREFAARSFVPLMFLYFALPGWGLIQPALQNMTVWSVTSALRAISIPVFIEGIYVTLPAGKFAIEEGCSGLKYFIVGCAISSLVAYLYSTSLKRRILIVLLGGALAIIGNWVRVFTVIMAGHVTEMQHPWIHDHMRLGWYIFAILLIPFFIISRRLEDDRSTDSSESTTTAVKSAEFNSVGGASAIRGPGFVAASLLVIGTLAVGPALTTVMKNECRDCAINLIMPDGANNWSVRNSQVLGWQPHSPGAAVAKSLVYERAGNQVILYVAVYGGGSNAADMINDENVFDNSRSWQLLNLDRRTIPMPTFDLVFNDLVLSRAGQRRFVGGYWYEINGKSVASRNMARLLKLLKPLSDSWSEGLIAFSIECGGDCENARTIGKQFLQDNYVDIRNSVSSAITEQSENR